MKKTILSSVIIWCTVVVVGSLMFGLFQDTFSLKFVLFDLIGYSILLSIPCFILFTISALRINKLTTNNIHIKSLLILAGTVLYLLTFILLNYLLEGKFGLAFWNSKLGYGVFSIYWSVMCISILFWKSILK